MTTGNCLFLGTYEDTEYIPHLKNMFNGIHTYVNTKEYSTLFELESYCSGKDPKSGASRSINKVVSTSTTLLGKLLALQGNVKDNPSLNDYAGSCFSYKHIDIVFVARLKQLFTVPYGRFICERFISKLVAPHVWIEPTQFRFRVPKEREYAQILEEYAGAFAIAIDIETLKKPLAIRCIGYTALFIRPDGSIYSDSITVPLNSSLNLEFCKKLNQLPPQKIFQNGKYDNAYLLRYNAEPTNWLWDTAHLFHSYYSELPKDLAFLNAFFLRKVVYWKDLAETNDLYEYYKYCALDTWATANVWIAQMLQMPNWARHNYVLEFPLVYPCLLSEMTGVLRDEGRLKDRRARLDSQIVEKQKLLARSVGNPSFNANSPKQVKALLKVLGYGDVPSTEESDLLKYAFAHPLTGYFVELILEIRGLRKLAGTYMRTDDDAKQSGMYAGEGGSKEFKGTWLYSQNPHGTDTARLSSGEHAFWCGANIQNVPVRDGPIVRETIVSPEGFLFGECDLEQAESRDTGYIAGEEKLIAAVTGTRDFHSINASAFFGKKYEDIYDDSIKKTKNKKLRDTAKRTNHGANYNMGAAVLVQTMGLKAIFDAKKELKLSYSEPLKIGDYLLGQFHVTYPGLRGTKAPYVAGTYYAAIVSEVTTTKRIVSRAFHHTGYGLAHYTPRGYIESGDWTRYCFGKPDKNKPDLNAYVAHPPQSLNARTLNEAYMRVFYEITLKYPLEFRQHAQIHDSILFSIRQGNETLAQRVRECMEIPVSVRDVHGTYRTFIVPAALKMGKDGNGAKYWSETE